VASRTSLRQFQQDLAVRLSSAKAEPASTARLGVQCGGEYWLIDLTEAGEIMAVPVIAPVPLTRHWYAGLANARGTLVSVVDFSAFATGKPTQRGPENRLVLVNAIYFKGNWADQFKKPLTKKAPFRIASGGTVEVPMIVEKLFNRIIHYATVLNDDRRSRCSAKRQGSSAPRSPGSSNTVGDLRRTTSRQFVSASARSGGHGLRAVRLKHDLP
jgi:hypothetical protein